MATYAKLLKNSNGDNILPYTRDNYVYHGDSTTDTVYSQLNTINQNLAEKNRLLYTGSIGSSSTFPISVPDLSKYTLIAVVMAYAAYSVTFMYKYTATDFCGTSLLFGSSGMYPAAAATMTISGDTITAVSTSGSTIKRIWGIA